jgi:hypothetical protein
MDMLINGFWTNLIFRIGFIHHQLARLTANCELAALRIEMDPLDAEAMVVREWIENTRLKINKCCEKDCSHTPSSMAEIGYCPPLHLSH